MIFEVHGDIDLNHGSMWRIANFFVIVIYLILHKNPPHSSMGIVEWKENALVLPLYFKENCFSVFIHQFTDLINAHEEECENLSPCILLKFLNWMQIRIIKAVQFS